MRLTRNTRFFAGLYALVSVLFTQFAVAGYACPDLQLGQSVNLADAMDSQAMPGCEGMDQDKPNLCKSHCEASSQSANSLHHAAPDAPVLAFLTVVAQPDFHVPSLVSIQGDLFASIADRPPSIRFCVLRI